MDCGSLLRLICGQLCLASAGAKQIQNGSCFWGLLFVPKWMHSLSLHVVSPINWFITFCVATFQERSLKTWVFALFVSSTSVQKYSPYLFHRKMRHTQIFKIFKCFYWSFQSEASTASLLGLSSISSFVIKVVACSFICSQNCISFFSETAIISSTRIHINPCGPHSAVQCGNTSGEQAVNWKFDQCKSLHIWTPHGNMATRPWCRENTFYLCFQIPVLNLA